MLGLGAGLAKPAGDGQVGSVGSMSRMKQVNKHAKSLEDGQVCDVNDTSNHIIMLDFSAILYQAEPLSVKKTLPEAQRTQDIESKT